MEAVRRMQGGEPAAVRAPSPNPLYLNPPYLRAFGAFPSDWLAKGVQPLVYDSAGAISVSCFVSIS